jgi:hypothetical protein
MFQSLAAHPWAYPALEVIHLLGVSLIIGNLLLLELRLFGRSEQIPIEALARLSLALVAIGFGLVLISGLLMFATQALDLISNRAFLLKMLLIGLAAANAAAFHARQSLQRADRTARLQMLISTLLWIAVLASGRAIGYL